MNPNQACSNEGTSDAALILDCGNAQPASSDGIIESLDDTSLQLISCPTCGHNLQQLPVKKQIEHYRRCVVTAFNQTSQELAPFLGNVADRVQSPAPPLTFASVGDWLQHLDLQQYRRLFLSAGHTMRSVHTLTEGELIAMGIPTVGARRRMLNSIDTLKRSLPPTADQPPLQAKKRIKAPKAVPTSAAAATSDAVAPPIHVASLPQLRTIARITEKAAEQTAAAMISAMPPAAPSPTVPFLADSSMPCTVPLFPGSVMRRVSA